MILLPCWRVMINNRATNLHDNNYNRCRFISYKITGHVNLFMTVGRNIWWKECFETTHLKAVPEIKPLVAGLLSRRHGFSARPVYVKFVLHKAVFAWALTWWAKGGRRMRAPPIFFLLKNCFADHSDRAVQGVGLQSLVCWDCGFESRRWHGCLSLVNVVCCQVEVSASGWSLVQRSPTDCVVSVCDRESLIKMRLWPTRGCCAMVKNNSRNLTTELKRCKKKNRVSVEVKAVCMLRTGSNQSSLFL